MFETENDISQERRSELNTLMNQRLADAVDLQAQMKQAHWNVKGPHFIGLHELFDQIDEAVESYVDLIAERIVQLGGVAEGSARVALSLQRKGLTRVRPLLGGIDAWREQHYPVEPRPSDGDATFRTVPRTREGVVANVASIPLLGGNQDQPAKSGNGKVSILLVATSLVWIAGCKHKAHVTPPLPMVEVVPVTKADVPIYHEWIGVLDGLVNAQIRA